VLYKLFYNMCFNNNKQANKKTIHLLLKIVIWENKNKTFIKKIYSTKKCYKLAYMDGVKT
jgi:hypothetical protein